MHNGTVPYFKQIKRSMISRISERAFQLIQGTTDSEMMLAMFITNFEKLAGLNEDSNAYHQEPGDGMDDPYPYVKNKEDYTQHLADALKQTLRQVLLSVINTHESKKSLHRFTTSSWNMSTSLEYNHDQQTKNTLN